MVDSRRVDLFCSRRYARRTFTFAQNLVMGYALVAFAAAAHLYHVARFYDSFYHRRSTLDTAAQRRPPRSWQSQTRYHRLGAMANRSHRRARFRNLRIGTVHDHIERGFVQ